MCNWGAENGLELFRAYYLKYTPNSGPVQHLGVVESIADYGTIEPIQSLSVTQYFKAGDTFELVMYTNTSTTIKQSRGNPDKMKVTLSHTQYRHE